METIEMMVIDTSVDQVLNLEKKEKRNAAAQDNCIN